MQSDAFRSRSFRNGSRRLQVAEENAGEITAKLKQPADTLSTFRNLITTDHGYSLREIDVMDQTVGPVICTYDFQVMGAATYYAKSAVNLQCLLHTNPELTTQSGR